MMGVSAKQELGMSWRQRGGHTLLPPARRMLLARSVLAAALTPQRVDVLRKKYQNTIPSQELDSVFKEFANRGEYVEWALKILGNWTQRNIADVGERFKERGEDLLSSNWYRGNFASMLAQTYDAAKWFDQAKTVRDPRVEQHSDFHPQKKWDVQAYNPTQISRMKDRYPRVYRPRDLFLEFADPVEVVDEKTRGNARWSMVKVDTDEFKDQIIAETKEALKVVASYVDQMGLDSPRNQGDDHKEFSVSTRNSYGIEIISSDIGTKAEPKSLYESFNKTVVEPLTALGYQFRAYEQNNRQFSIFAKTLKAFLAALCRFALAAQAENDGDESWCTSDPRQASYYLKDGPIYVILKDGRPVAQYHEESQQLQTTDRSELYEDRNETGNLSESDAEFIRDWLEQHTDYTGGEREPEIDWGAIESSLSLPHVDDYYMSEEISNALDEYRWLDDESDVDDAISDLAWADDGDPPEWSRSIEQYLSYTRYGWNGKKIQACRAFMESNGKPSPEVREEILSEWGSDENTEEAWAEAVESMLDDLRDEASTAYSEADEAKGRIESVEREFKDLKSAVLSIRRAIRDEDLDALRYAIRDAQRNDDAGYFSELSNELDSALENY
ncbi:MAG: hypothetical protein E6R03_17390 [Hyphomicrobiaceae bacterium]|nr:MAG: hypothetical protein E6R03_17390 [Hyphomicrobiaceae bacterium]